MGIENMFLSILCGLVASKFVRKWYNSLILALGLGILIGYLAILYTDLLVYPFFIAITPDIVSIPEVSPLSVFFITKQIEIYRFSLYMYNSLMQVPMVIIIYVTSSFGSVILGQVIGRKLLGRIKIIEE
jgi:hypothetical protein